MKVRKAVVPVAGLGTRMLPATKAIPKELVPIVRRPAVQWVVEAAVASGIEEVVFVTAPVKSAIEAHFRPDALLEGFLERRGKEAELRALRVLTGLARVSIAVQHEPLGLGHAVLMAREAVGDEPFAVILPDELVLGPTPALRQCLDAMTGADAVIGIVEVPDAELRRYGIVGVREHGPLTRVIDDVVEKPATKAEAPSNFAISGPYVLPPESFDDLERTQPQPGGEIYLTDALLSLAKRRTMLGRLIEGERLDVGNPLGFVQANVVLGLADAEIGGELREWLRGRVGGGE